MQDLKKKVSKSIFRILLYDMMTAETRVRELEIVA